MYKGKKGVKVNKEPANWGLNYPNMSSITIDAAIAWMQGNSPLPPTMDEMLDRDPKYDQDVFTIVGLLRFQLDSRDND